MSRIGKKLPRTNIPGSNTIKLFTSAICSFFNRLECSYLAGLSGPTEAYPSGTRFMSKEGSWSDPFNIRTSLERPAKNNTKNVNYGRKFFITFDQIKILSEEFLITLTDSGAGTVNQMPFQKMPILKQNKSLLCSYYGTKANGKACLY